MFNFVLHAKAIAVPKLMLAIVQFAYHTALLKIFEFEGYAEVAKYLLIVSIALSFINITIHSSYERFYAEAGFRNNLSVFRILAKHALAGNLLLGAITSGIYLGLFFDEVTKISLIFCSSCAYLVAYGPQYFFLVVARYEERQSEFYWTQLFAVLLSSIIIIFVVYKDPTLELFLIGQLISLIIIIGWYVYLSKNILRGFKEVVNSNGSSLLLTQIPTYTIKNLPGAALNGIGNSLDRLILSFTLSDQLFGFYSYVVRNFILVAIVSSTYKSVLIPKLYMATKEEFSKLWFISNTRSTFLLISFAAFSAFVTFAIIQILDVTNDDLEFYQVSILTFAALFVFDRHYKNIYFFGPERAGKQHLIAFKQFVVMPINIFMLYTVALSTFSLYSIGFWLFITSLMNLFICRFGEHSKKGQFIALSSIIYISSAFSLLGALSILR